MQNIFFLDYETTGLNIYQNDIIEVAIKKKDEEHYYQTFVKPGKMPKGSLFTYVPPDIVTLTNITDQIIHKHGIQRTVATYNMFKYIENNADKDSPIYIVSHNGNSFDFLILRKLLSEYSSGPGIGINKKVTDRIQYIDTLLLAKLFMGKNVRLSQPKLCLQYGIVNEAEHRALGDIQALDKLYSHLCIDYAKYNDKEEDYYLENPHEIQLFI